MRTLAQSATGVSLILSALVFGFRHGIDWDHIAAITDITASQESSRRGVLFGTLYALGHAIVVFAIGVLAIAIGQTLPESIDRTMGRVVGATLLLLGVYVFYALIRHGRDFRLRSRWMIVFSFVRSTYSWISVRLGRKQLEDVEHEHEHAPGVHHEHEAHHSHTSDADAFRTHRHRHRHAVPSDPFMSYGVTTSIVIGMLHGIGAETPTQVLIFLVAAEAGGAREGIAVLGVFLLGLFAANTLITLGSSYGFLAATKRFAVYAAVSVLTALVSLFIGTLLVLGKEGILPAFFG